MARAMAKAGAGAGAGAAPGAGGPTLEAVLRSTPRLSPSMLQQLSAWARAQPHFPPLTDLDLVRVLNGAGYDLERGKKVLDCYLAMRRHAPELFAFRDPRACHTRRQLALFHVAPSGRDASGNSVVCMGFERRPIKHMDYNDIAFLVVSMMELVVRRDPGCAGYVVVADAANFTPQHQKQVSMALVRRLSTYFQDALPATVNAIHAINLTPVVEAVLNMVKPFLHKSVREKFFFYSMKKLDGFYQKVPKRFLPKDYGGNLDESSVFFEELKKELVENIDYLQYLDTLVVDENLRPGGPRRPRDYFGFLDSLLKS